jgi:tetratricopeptide (TPR) repeat protein
LPAPDIYPTPLVFTLDKVLRPKAEMLRWYEAVLRALPVFAEKHLQTQPDGSHPPVEAALTVQTSIGKTNVLIRYPGGDLAQIRNWRGLRIFKDDEETGTANVAVPDRRALEGSLAGLAASLSEDSIYADPTVADAQELMYEAWEETTPARRTSLAKKALKLSADCADAYVLLAEEAKTKQQALELYQKGVEAGRRALGTKFFADTENIGHFWGIIETRPFMRAVEGLATTLWDLGRLDEAQTQYRELLRLNPGDNQGIRYSLLTLLLELDQVDEAGTLLKEFEGDWSADWAYSEALLAFRKYGSSRQAQAALKRALKVNRHVPDYLTGKKRVPLDYPPYVTMGGEDEAIQYAKQHLNFWRKTPGAVAWLEKTV